MNNLNTYTIGCQHISYNSFKCNFYLVRVKLNSEESRIIPDFSPTPGMPAEVYIKTAERTFFQYIVKPVHDSMMRAFRER